MEDRRFSRRCAECHQRAMKLTTVPYTVQVDHDGRKYTVTIPDLDVPKCSNCGAISIDAVAEREIDNAFRREAHLLTPEQIFEGRNKLGLSQKQLACCLGIAPETLSRWENGSQVQQRSLDKFLRAFFELPKLREYLEYPPRRGTITETVASYE